MTTLTTDIVRSFYAKLGAGDAPGALALMAPDIEWITMWHYKVDGRGPDSSRKACSSRLRRSGRASR